MRKIVSLCLAAVFCGGLLAGCGKLEVTRDTIYIQKNGKVTAVSMDELDKDYYSEQELEEYVDQEAAAYTSENGNKSLKVDSFEVQDSAVTLQLTYASSEDYVSFNGTVLFSGTVEEALNAGYDFDMEFYSAGYGSESAESEEEQLSDEAAEEEMTDGSVDGEEITAHSDYKVVITNEALNVKVDGDILYVSGEDFSMEDESTVSIPDPGDSQVAGLTYIVYQ